MRKHERKYFGYRALQEMFHTWADAKSLMPVDRNMTMYTEFHCSLPDSIRERCPENLEMYKKFCRLQDFFVVKVKKVKSVKGKKPKASPVRLRQVTDVLDPHPGVMIVNVDCVILNTLFGFPAKKKCCEEDKRRRYYFIIGNQIYYSILVIQKFINDNQVCSEKDYVLKRGLIKKSEIKMYYPENLKIVYGKKCDDLIFTAKEEVKE